MKRFIVICLFLFACSSSNVKPKPAPVPDSDACSVSCRRLSNLGCEEGRPIDMGHQCVKTSSCADGEVCLEGTCHVTCEQFCRNTQENGVWLNPHCVAKLTSCKQLEDDTCPGNR